MRSFPVALMLSFVCTASLRASDAEFDWRRWGDLPVQSDGRHKPLDTLAWETLRLISNQTVVTDPATDEERTATAIYLALLFDWQGWDHPQRDRLVTQSDGRPLYFQLHQPDRWDKAPLLRVDHLELRGKLDLEPGAKYIAPLALSKTLIEDPRGGKKIPFPAWSQQLLTQDDKGATLSDLEKKGLELAHRLWAYQNLRMGRSLEILPLKASETREWLPIASLFLTKFDSANDPTGQYRQAQKLLHEARAAYRGSDAEAFHQMADELKATLRSLGEDLGDYPDESMIKLEVAYNRWAPFRVAWLLTLTATLGMLLHLGTGWRCLSIGALAAYGLGMAAMVAGFSMRVAISGRPPVSNMYESVIYVGFGVALFGLLFALIYQSKVISTAAAGVATVALLLADTCPSILDPSLRPLEPVLRSNFWLIVHVMTITLSYAAFALALGIANVTLGYFLAGSRNLGAVAALNRFTYKAMQVGVLLLAAGTILGGVWADYSWGRFWGWDPKEVWALVALLGYLCVLHARYAGWVGQRGLPALAVACFALVVMAWYGVNFVLGAGLHSYGFGAGGSGWVGTAVVFELLYTGLALWRNRRSAMRPPEFSQVYQTRVALSTVTGMAVPSNAPESRIADIQEFSKAGESE